LLSRLLDLARSRSRTEGPSGCRAYAIGDVHGRLDLVKDLLARIERDDAARPAAKTYLVLLGDLIDRGPDSAGVIDHFVRQPPTFARPVYLKGNHEEFLLNVLDGEDDMVGSWLTYGGYECAESYGVSKGWTLNVSSHEVAERLRAAVPDAHRRFLADMADSFQFGGYLFVHAGIRPGVPLDQQNGKDLRWIREGFLDNRNDHGVMVVHGHTIVDRPEQHPNRIALDTGAYRSGVLTALGIEGRERWFIEARSEAAAA